MNTDRSIDEGVHGDAMSPTPGFLLLPVAPAEPATASPLQWLYQKLYEQAAQKSQMRKPDLFAIMN